MATKEANSRDDRRRQPRQERALHKVSLIMEAAMQLLDRGDIASLTTDAVAARAGVSIGTLYQYFRNKQAILDALSQREVEGMVARVLKALRLAQDSADEHPVRRVVQAVMAAYGGRRRVHRTLLEYALSRSTGSRLQPMYADVIGLLVSGQTGAAPLSAADAFVLTHAVGGVLRAVVAQHPVPVPRKDIEDALVRLIELFEVSRHA